jgi:tight adherence protein C
MAQLAISALPKVGSSLVPRSEVDRTKLQARLIEAGYYSRQALAVFLGVKMLLTIGPALLGLLLGLAGVMPVAIGLIIGAMCGILGLIGPSFWLDMKKTERQRAFRRALPDALDVMVICLEGGLSLAAAFRKVSSELGVAHPLLAAELNILQREMQLGLSPGEALRHFADRTDLEELRTLSSVVQQSERLGAGLAQALRVHAEALRFKRLQWAEEMAGKAAVKMLFPTLFLIFPGIFVVILGPAGVRILELFAQMKR